MNFFLYILYHLIN